MINITIGGSKGGSVKLAAFRREMVPALKRGIDRATMILAREIREHQLSMGGTYPLRPKGPYIRNPGVNLRMRSGMLKSSWITRIAAAIPGGVEGAVTSRSPYGRIHEFGGFIGRKLHISAKPVKNLRRGILSAIHAYETGLSSGGRTVYIKPRPYIRPAIAVKGREAAQAIVTEIMKPLRRPA